MDHRKEQIASRIKYYAQANHKDESTIVSVKLRPLDKQYSQEYLNDRDYKFVREQGEYIQHSTTPQKHGWFDLLYKERKFLWIQHETGPEVIGEEQQISEAFIEKLVKDVLKASGSDGNSVVVTIKVEKRTYEKGEIIEKKTLEASVEGTIDFGKLDLQRGILREAVRNVPELKYAWGVVAIVAILSMVKYFGVEDVQFPFAPTLFVIGAIFLVFILSYFARKNDPSIRAAMLILIFAITLSTVAFLVGMVSYVFTGKPDFYDRIFGTKPIEQRGQIIADKGTLQLTVFVHGPGGKQDIVLENEGELVVDLSSDRRVANVGENGRTNFGEIPNKFLNEKISIFAKSSQFSSESKEVLFTGDPVYFEVTPLSKLGLVRGIVRSRDGSSLVAGATVQVNQTSGQTDSLGRFSFVLPKADWSDEYDIYISKEGYKLGREKYYPLLDPQEYRLELK